ncbi:MAG: valine--tRNA ligase [Clostridia bacterium]|nr:valine--tRNA ligase [Clostridia bacterium]
MDNMEKTYNPEFEQKIYNMWIKGKYFEAHPNPDKEPFTIVMPPPNITGQLHMGHALNNTLQDIIIRFKRMSGFETLWVPGTDHASIATEVKIVDKLKAEGLKKEDIGRDEFLVRAWDWKKQYGGRIVEQLKRLGTSCDWSKEAFTMDENCSNSVLESFVRYYKKGLIYRGNRIINWCPHCRTALSDAEVEYEEQPSNLWYYKYPVVGEDDAIVIATTRPETMLGDTAVAVNPKDEKMNRFIGKMVQLPLTDRVIPVVGDDYCEIGFGTGAVKITPAHDPNDFELGLRHNLEVISCIGEDGLMNENAGKYKGMDRLSCRQAVVEDLDKLGLLVKIEPYAHNVGTCYRCHETVEAIVSKQWFVKMKPLAEPAIKAVKSKKTVFVPQRFEKTYFNWMENIKDWCISRQLWWGHRIPAYYCDDCGEMVVSKTKVDTCPKCGGKMHQDEDVLDTWFSSALWPFSTLGYPKKNKNLSYFYPTNVLVTAYDIIFFWVARMMFSGIEFMEEPPFSQVLIHGIVRDSQGRKMSKSLGNGVDPLEIIDKYGADALRFSLAQGIAPGSDTRFSEGKIESCRNFVNKLWNASRFVIMNIKDDDSLEFPSRLNGNDKWILTRLNDVIKEVTINLNKYEIGIAAATLYDFVWTEFCDWFIEISKPQLYSEDKKQHQHAIAMLVYVLTEILKLLHPFIPFITEEIYSKFAPKGSVLMIQEWPSYNKRLVFRKEAKNFEELQEIVIAVRNMRNEMNLQPSKRISAYIIAKDPAYIKSVTPFFEKLCGINNVMIIENKDSIQEQVSALVTAGAELYIPLGDLIDKDKEIARIKDEIAQTEAVILKTENLLANKGFVAKAPQKLVDGEKEKLAAAKEKLIKLQDKLKMFE